MNVLRRENIVICSSKNDSDLQQIKNLLSEFITKKLEITNGSLRIEAFTSEEAEDIHGVIVSNGFVH